MLRRLILVLGTSFAVSSVIGANYYVSTGGNDSTGNGSQASPWRTIQKAANTVSAGDDVYVANGNYSEFVTVNSSGTAANKIKFVGPASLIGFCLRGSHIVVSNVTCDRSLGAAPPGDSPAKYPLVEFLGNYNLLVNSTVNGRGAAYNCTKFGGRSVRATGNTIRNCAIQNSGLQFFLYMAGLSNTVELCDVSGSNGDVMHIDSEQWGVFRSNNVHNIAYSDALHTDIFQMIGHSGANASNFIVEANWIHDTDAQLGNFEQTTGGTKGRNSDVIFRNNVFENVRWCLFAGVFRMMFYNNTFYNVGSSQYGAIMFYDSALHDCDGSEAIGNVFVNCTQNPMSGPLNLVNYHHNFGSTASYGAISGSLGANSINSGKPQNVNPGAHDFRIQASSILRDRGVTIPSFNTDKDGAMRSGTWDLGAYEYGGGPSTNPVISVTPSNLDFGLLPLNSSVTNSVIVRNVGGGTLAGSAALPANTRFSIIDNSGSYSLSSNESKTVKIRYQPTSQAGSDNTTLTFTGGGGASVALRGASFAILPGLSFESYAGTISSPFVTNNGYITQLQQTGVTDAGQAVYGFSITTPGSYIVSASVNAPDDTANSVFVGIDGQPADPTMIWDIPITSGFEPRTVSWRGNGTFDNPQFVPAVFNLTAGPHQLIIRGREAGVQLARITISPYSGNPPGSPQNLRVIAGF